MTHRFVLLQHRLVCLAVLIRTAGVAAFVQEELGLVQILLVARHQVELGQCHFGNLVSRHAHHLSFAFANLAAHAVGIADGDVQEVALARSLVVRNGTLYHVSQVVEFVAQVLYQFPALGTGPFVRMFGVHGTAGVEVSVRLLCGSHNHQHAVNVLLQLIKCIHMRRFSIVLT